MPTRDPAKQISDPDCSGRCRNTGFRRRWGRGGTLSIIHFWSFQAFISSLLELSSCRTTRVLWTETPRIAYEGVYAEPTQTLPETLGYFVLLARQPDRQSATDLHTVLLSFPKLNHDKGKPRTKRDRNQLVMLIYSCLRETAYATHVTGAYAKRLHKTSSPAECLRIHKNCSLFI